MLANIEGTAEPREDMLEAMAEVLDDQARVARAEVALAAAKRRLLLAEARLGRLQRTGVRVSAEREERGAETLRVRIVAAMEARPKEVFTPAGIAAVVGAQNRDSVRNTLLVLAERGRIEKVGMGRYQARGGEG